MRRSGFTLVDVLLTIIIVGLLASIMIPKFQGAQIRAKHAARAELIAIYTRAVQRFQADTDLYPVQLADLASTSAPANGLSTGGVLTPLRPALWRGPYVSGIQADPVTGKPFGYITSGPYIGTIVPPMETEIGGIGPGLGVGP